MMLDSSSRSRVVGNSICLPIMARDIACRAQLTKTLTAHTRSYCGLVVADALVPPTFQVIQGWLIDINV